MLKHAAAGPVCLDRFERGTESARATAFFADTLDELEEDRPDLDSPEDLMERLRHAGCA
jgi:hypothetical protein